MSECVDISQPIGKTIMLDRTLVSFLGSTAIVYVSTSGASRTAIGGRD